MPDNATQLGRAILQLLELRQISQAALARESGYSAAYVNKLIRGGKRECTVGCLVALAKPLGGEQAFIQLCIAMREDMLAASAVQAA